MRAGFPLARFGAALACSLAAHAAAAWWLAGRLAPPAQAAGGGGDTVRARLMPQAAAPAADAPAPGPVKSARPAADPRKPPPAPAVRYYEAVELDVKPQVMTHVMPQYPEDVLTGTRGRVVLELYVGADGTVDRTRVALSEPAGRFDGAAARAFAAARFTPGVKSGKPVASKLLIEVTFGD